MLGTAPTTSERQATSHQRSTRECERMAAETPEEKEDYSRKVSATPGLHQMPSVHVRNIMCRLLLLVGVRICSVCLARTSQRPLNQHVWIS